MLIQNYKIVLVKKEYKSVLYHLRLNCSKYTFFIGNSILKQKHQEEHSARGKDLEGSGLWHDFDECHLSFDIF